MQPVLHLIFKTHLDLGFTGYAAEVRRQYHDYFIPMALDTGEHFLREDAAEPKFVWTTGSWLIWDHLETQAPDKVARLERAIATGIIRWHALPFTTHTELMSPPLVREALSISAELDARFGLITRAGKMTDVPGHTLGLVPLLAEAGVRFLHIGVNSASMPPDVPPLFRWRAPDGSEVVVLYQSEYGTTFKPDGVADGIAFAHTMDNMGPQNVGHVVDSFHALGEANPGFVLRASTLDAYGDMLWGARDSFPVVENEIGDTWIHGVGSAPRRISRYLEARRTYDAFATSGLTPSRRAFGRKLLEVAEHTWGVDIKTYLRDETAWDRPAFEAARRSDPRFAFAEGSWAEQDAIVDDAIAQLPESDRPVLAEPLMTPSRDDRLPIAGEHTVGPFGLTFDPVSGALRALSRAGERLVESAPDSPGLFAFEYESYDAADYDAYMDTYLTARFRWGVQDHGKPGLERAASARSARYRTSGAVLERLGEGLRVVATCDPVAAMTFGAPAEIHTLYTAGAAGLSVTVMLPGKPANRMPEAGFMSFAPAARPDSWRMEKLGLAVAPGEVVSGGNRQLHAVDAVFATTPAGRTLRLATLDAPLFAPGAQPFLPFTREAPDMAQGGRFNVFNNKWGTNFAMWCEGDLGFRFTLEVDGRL